MYTPILYGLKPLGKKNLSRYKVWNSKRGYNDILFKKIFFVLFLKVIQCHFLPCDYCNRGHLDKVDQLDSNFSFVCGAGF